MRLCVIGCGSIGLRHIKNAASLGHGVSAVDIDKTQRGSALWAGADLAESEWRWVSEPTDPTIDAVMICTPAHTHAAIARDLLTAGYRGPLFVEKPLALSVAECDVFRNWPHPTTMVGYNWRFNAEVGPFLKRSGFAHLICNANMATWPGTAYADPLIECSHDIDLALWRERDQQLGDAGDLCGGGMWLQFTSSVVDIRWRATQQGREYYRANPPTWLERYLRLPPRCSDRLLPSVTSIIQSYEAELSHFLDCAQRRIPTETPFADGISVLDVIEQAQKLAGVPSGVTKGEVSR